MLENFRLRYTSHRLRDNEHATTSLDDAIAVAEQMIYDHDGRALIYDNRTGALVRMLGPHKTPTSRDLAMRAVSRHITGRRHGIW
jgi:hypothetical protein